MAGPSGAPAFGRELATVPGLLDAAGRRFGASVAVEDDGTVVTFAELARRTNEVGIAVLDRARERAGTIVVLLGDGLDPVIMTLGVLSTGRTCVPFDPREPSVRLTEMVRSVRPQLVLTVAAHESLAAAIAPDVDVVLLEDVGPTDRQCLRDVYREDDAALVMFTSGSTGAPKGVVLPYTSHHLRGEGWATAEQLTADDRIAQLSSLSYVMGVLRPFSVLASGASLHSYDLVRRGPRDLLGWMREREITVLNTVPSVLRALHDLAPSAAPSAAPVTTVRRLAVGGETAFASDVHVARALFGPDVEVVNMIGATESSLGAYHVVGPGDDPGDGRLPIGIPWPSSTVMVVDDDDRPVPDGEPGRFVISNGSMAVGYWDQPELTAEFFFRLDDGRRAFRTSDLVRRRPDGLLEHLGRLDARVKIRGTMVAISEVEAALVALDGVADAAVVAIDHGEEGHRLVAYVAPRPGESISGWQVRREVARALPSGMVPSTVVVLDALPRTVRGKHDRAALPAPPALARPRPPTPSEREVIAVFVQVLDLEEIGPDDDFFALGGDSLAAVELVAALGDRFGVDVNTALLLDAPTPALLAPRLGTRRPRDASVLVRLQDAGDGVPFVCVAGGGSSALSLRALCAAVDDGGPARPLVAVQARGLEERAWPDRSVSAMARRTARAVVDELGRGPVLLGGYSFGGLVAFETALRLVESGVEVRGLVMIDAPAPSNAWSSGLRTWRRLTRPTLAAAASGPGAPPTRTGVADRLRHTARGVRRLAVGVARRATAGVVPRRGLAQYDLFLDLHAGIATRYRPSRRFRGPAVVLRFVGPGRLAPKAPPDLGWPDWVDGTVSVVELRGKHVEMLRPPLVGAVGAALRDALALLEDRG